MKQNILYLLKGLLFSILLMAGFVFLLAFLLQQTGWNDSILTGLILAAFCLSGFLGGLYFAKHAPKQRYLWGLLFGGVYFLSYLAFFFLTVPTESFELNHTLLMLACALSSGCLGGMLS